eukprot:8809306-Ditylum_brightwellii.AAC.1
MSKQVKAHIGETFPFLDMEMYWGRDGGLKFKVYRKPNQALKRRMQAEKWRRKEVEEHIAINIQSTWQSVIVNL